MGKQWKQCQTSFVLGGGGATKSLQILTVAMKLKDACSLKKKSYDKPRQCMKKQRHCFADKCLYSQSYGFSIVMYGCQNWIIKKAESQRIDAFELWCWRRLLRVPWTARRSNQFILKEISPGCSLKGLTLKLKLQYFGHFMQRVDSLEKTLMLGEIGGRRRRGQLPGSSPRWIQGFPLEDGVCD